jgi:taurine--2-oxoglutarate transaminase
MTENGELADPLAGIPADKATILRLARSHVFHSWSAQAQIDPLPIASASGSYFVDYDGKRYLDFCSQMVNVNIGHQHPRLVKAIQDYAAHMTTIQPSFANGARSEAARLICELAGPGFRSVFFTNAGAEANENAIRMARLHTGRSKILAMYRSYHGATHGVIGVTGDERRWGTEPYTIPGTVHFWGPYLYRSVFHSDSPEQETDRALAHLRDTIMAEGGHTIAAIILEPVVGTNGILVPPPGYLAGVREICDQRGILLIADEVMSGFGRCGEWFAVQHWDVTPDLITFAKGVNSGYIPLGGVIVSEQVAATFDNRSYPGGLTYQGHPLACASAVASIEIFKDERILENARNLGSDVIGPELAKIFTRHPSVGEVRGLGVFWALELVRDRATREPLVRSRTGAGASAMKAVTTACKQRGLWPRTNRNRIHIVPPCTTTDAEAREGLAILDEALNTADEYYTG